MKIWQKNKPISIRWMRADGRIPMWSGKRLLQKYCSDTSRSRVCSNSVLSALEDRGTRIQKWESGYRAGFKNLFCIRFFSLGRKINLSHSGKWMVLLSDERWRKCVSFWGSQVRSGSAQSRRDRFWGLCRHWRAPDYDRLRRTQTSSERREGCPVHRWEESFWCLARRPSPWWTDSTGDLRARWQSIKPNPGSFVR